MPIFQSATFEYRGETSYHALRYIRLNNTPNHVALHEKLAALENAEAALVTSSGMAAVSTTLFALLNTGDRIIAQDCLYGGTHDLFTLEFPRFGIGVDFINSTAGPAAWRKLLNPHTKIIYVETISNPLMQVADLKAVVEFARAHNLISIVDNTFASPVNFRPSELGFDLSIHSFLLHRGMKTLAVRVRYQNESALRIARFLERHPQVAAVNYPGLENHPHHLRACELLDGFGGMLSFELKGGVGAAESFIHNVTLPICAPSLGGVESLITRPATTSHAGMTPEDRRRAGIADGLIRFSVGLETCDDLIEDFDRALQSG